MDKNSSSETNHSFLDTTRFYSKYSHSSSNDVRKQGQRYATDINMLVLTLLLSSLCSQILLLSEQLYRLVVRPSLLLLSAPEQLLQERKCNLDIYSNIQILNY